MPKIVFTDATVRAINSVNQDVAYDVQFEPRTSYKKQLLIVAETCLDANRMTMAGYPEADAEVKSLVDAHGYDAVLKAAAEIVSVA